MDVFLNETLDILSSVQDGDPIHACGIAALTQLREDPGAAHHEADIKLRSVFPFKDVPICWRRMYTDASIKLALQSVQGGLGLVRGTDAGQKIRSDEESGAEKGVRIVDGETWQNPLKRSIEQSTEDPRSIDDPAWLTETVRYLDMALIMTGGCMREDLIASFVKQLEHTTACLATIDDGRSFSEPARKRIKITDDSATHSLPAAFPEDPRRLPAIQFPIKGLSMTLSAFQRHLESPETTPIVLKGLIESWPALHERPWRSPKYLLQRTLGGRRLVPIEIGRSYTDEGWSQKIVSFGDFLEKYIVGASSSKFKKDCKAEAKADDPSLAEDQGIAYLAQHDLFAQVPSLRKDISIPDLCYANPPPPNSIATSSAMKAKVNETTKLDEPLLNAWFGPAGTISPLHTDPYHNILCQVVGKKYVRLYAPAETERLEPRGDEDGIDMSNTSSIPVEVVEMGALAAEDCTEGRWDRFDEAPYVETILSEGESLYIPVGWWHYVRSLTVSFSVSFWWN